ncbi:MAG: LamG domain-containing protein [Myxococcota bacterium]|nr:LamG domain-containing protein [Myxococcota bacterium]
MLRWLALVACTAACGRLSFTSIGTDAAAESAESDAIDASPTGTDAIVDRSVMLSLDFDGPDPLGDASRFAHQSTCTSCPTFEPGRQGLAARFTRGNCIVLADAPAFRPAVFTVAAWVRPRIDAHMTFIGRPIDPPNTIANSYELWRADDGIWYAAIEPRGLSAGSTPPDLWHHVAATYDGTAMTLYLDGVLRDTIASTAAPHGASDVRIGCDVNVGVVESFFDGWIDDIRLYDRALSAAEVATLAQ